MRSHPLAHANRRPTTALLAVVLIAFGGLASCGSDDAPAAATTSTTSTTDRSSAPSTTTSGDTDVPVDVADLSAAAIVLTPVAELDMPIALATHPGSPDLFVAERTGRVLTVSPAGDIGTTVIDIRADTTIDAERGLFDLTFSPDGSHLYLSFTDRRGDTRVDEWSLDGTRADPASRRTVFTQSQPYANHNGGDIGFGPDGLLYLGLGDGGGGGDPLGAGQDPDTLLGKIIRIDPAPDGDAPYTIPTDNPFAEGGGAPEIFISGVRNPWRFSWDSATGDLWVADVGQNEAEEINWLPADGDTPAGLGANLGWSILEGNLGDGPEPPDYVGPIHTYGHGPECSITGGLVVRDPRLTTLFGAYLFSDFCHPTINAILKRDGVAADIRSLDVEVPGGAVVSFGEGPDREVYVLSLMGRLFRIDPA